MADQSAEKEHGTTTRMSVVSTVPSSPTSECSDDTISEASVHYNHDFPEKTLTPHISRASSTSAVGGVTPSRLSRKQTNKSTATNATTDPDFEVDWEEDDKRNPMKWPLWYKGVIIGVMSYATTCVVMYSTSYTSAIPGMQETFGISDSTGILGVTTYLIGMATGSVILAPLSEMYGRRPIYIVALSLFTILLLPCALAPNIEAILVTRFFGAFCASAMISNAPGTVNDISDEDYRALAFSIWSIGPMNGPVIGPVVGGFVFQYLGWRWTNWVVMICAGIATIVVSLIQETYGPAILRSRAAKRRKETGDDRYWSRYDEKAEFWPLLKLNLSRPFVMTVTEPILIFWDLYIAIVYGILYLCFVAYPIVFTDMRGWSPGLSGLAFCGIGVGSMIVIVCEPLLRKWINSHKNDPETGKPPPEAAVSVIIAAAVLIPTGEIIFAWTCTPNVHWIWPILAGIPFGAGNCGVFIYGSNYLVHSYGIFAASALAGNAVLRSILGATLPLAGPAMYNSLGANWAGTLLALLEFACIPIPVVFYRYGSKIRRKSPLIRSMQEDKKRMDNKKQRAEDRAEALAEKRAEAEADTGAPMETGAAMYEEADIERGLKMKELS